MGPGGLDPLEVFPTLPEKMQTAFDQKDTPMLQEALLELTDEERKYHMKRVVDSGLWVPGAGGSTRVEDEEYDDDEEEEDEE
ncbi:unnamed protein product, partial [Ectocarpus fasciculatus]